MKFAARLGQVLRTVAALPFRLASRLTRDGLLFIALAFFCAVGSALAVAGANILLLMGLMLASLWLLSLSQGSRSLKDIRVRRSCSEWIFAGEPLQVSLMLGNSGLWPSAGVLVSEQIEADDVPLNAEASPAVETSARPSTLAPRTALATGGSFATLIPGRGQQRIGYTLVLRRRGIYRFGETRLETVAPLGFFHSSQSRTLPGRMVVYPRLGEISRAFFDEMEKVLQDIRRTRPSRAEEEFRGLREYRRGDNPKWIHWRSSARAQTMLVKEFEEPQARRVLLLLDTNLQQLGAQRFAAFETAISFAGTLVRDLLRRDCEVQFAALQPNDRVVHLTVSRPRRNLDQLLEQLAGLKREDRRTLGGVGEVLGRRSLHNVYVLVLGLGSLRNQGNIKSLSTGDNIVRVIDVRSEDFRRIFRRIAGAGRDSVADEDMLADLAGDEEPEPIEAL